jgi:hypothetical protein
MKNLSFFPFAALILSLNLTPVGAVIVLEFKEVGSDVVVDISGSWDSWTKTGAESYSSKVITAGVLYNNNGSQDLYKISPAVFTLSSGQWTSKYSVATSSSGDDFGFRAGESSSDFYAPTGYSQGDPISSQMIFAGTDLPTMGFTNGDSGAFTGGGNTVNFSVTAIPEPNSYGVLLGAAGLATAIFFRRRRRSSAV